ncbi:MAG: Hsp20/alpha crystallin family protein [Gammaproteobacteria bacterium]|nr:Hsp20/alpha crystallin family protein [Gammaproteobacteria bacterium]
MSMISYNPYRSSLRGADLNRLFNGLFPRMEEEETAAGYDWSPAVDIKEEGNCYAIHADVPGIKPEDIDISVEDGVLTIRGERKFDNEEDKDSYKRIERARGTFFRRFNLPDTADQNKVTAKCKDGVLKVVIEKQDKVLPRKITIHS